VVEHGVGDGGFGDDKGEEAENITLFW